MSKEKKIVIGVGGAGTKSLEAFLYLMAAGVGIDDEVRIGIVDQDQTNGSGNAAEKTIADYIQLRRTLRSQSGDYLGASALLSGAIQYDPAKSKWCPAVSNDETLSKLLGYPTEQDENLRDLFGSLFEPSARELGLPLNEGFRGRPFLGAAVMTHRARQAIDANEGLWGDIKQLIEDQQVSDVHCVLVGSIFGGTGASGIPTIAKQLRDMPAAKGKKVRISAVLLLPYFSYADEGTGKSPGADDGNGKVSARSAESLSRAGNALRYYGEIVREDVVPLFDTAYLVGWQPAVQLQHPSDGGPDQKNPPMIVELLAGLGISRLLSLDGEAATRSGFSLLGRSEKNSFSWADLPELASGGRARERLRQFTRFCLAYRYFYSAAMHGEPHLDLWRERARHELRLDFRTQETNGTLDALAAFCGRYLQWIAALQWADPVQRAAVTDPRAIDLVRADGFADPLSETASTAEAQLRAALRAPDDARAHRSLSAAFPELFMFEKADAQGPSLSRIFYKFCYGAWPKDSRALGALAGSLYEACAD
jgi:hypothetical protein